MADPRIQKIEADAIFYAVMTCLPVVTQAYRYFRAQGKTEEDFDRCAREAMTKAVHNAVALTAREVKDPVWPYALEGASAASPSASKTQALTDEQIALLRNNVALYRWHVADGKPESLAESVRAFARAIPAASPPQDQRDAARWNPEPPCWLVEQRANGRTVAYLGCQCGAFEWYPAPDKATRFVRREDANGIAEIFEDLDVILVEHIWG